MKAGGQNEQRSGRLGAVIWIDLLDPTPDERGFGESRSRIRVPSKHALSEIKASSRLNVERGMVYPSSPMVARRNILDAHLPQLTSCCHRTRTG